MLLSNEFIRNDQKRLWHREAYPSQCHRFKVEFGSEWNKVKADPTMNKTLVADCVDQTWTQKVLTARRRR